MTVEAEQTSSSAGHRDEVSGAVVHVLINLVHDLKGDVGVAQALAMAGDGRSFAALADTGTWSSLEEAVALFNAAALVSGDGAVGLHVGEKLLYVPDGSGLVDRFRALDSPGHRVQAHRTAGRTLRCHQRGGGARGGERSRARPGRPPLGTAGTPTCAR